MLYWPISLDELTRWYERVEETMEVGPRPPTAWTRRMHGAAESLGWNPFAAPAAAATDPSPLLPRTAIEIVSGTVTAIERDARGRATGVTFIDDDGRPGTRRAAAVVVAASVIPTVRLLLLSDLTADGPPRPTRSTRPTCLTQTRTTGCGDTTGRSARSGPSRISSRAPRTASISIRSTAIPQAIRLPA